MAGVMIGSPLTGIISDHFGRRPTLLVCLGTASVLSMSMAFIPNLIVLIVIRFLAGFFLAVSLHIFNDLYLMRCVYIVYYIDFRNIFSCKYIIYISGAQ